MSAALAPRSDFPLLAANPGLHYLDSAATSQKPRVVLDALRDFYETANANPHRGAIPLPALSGWPTATVSSSRAGPPRA